MSNSILVVNIGHTHGPAVSAFAESPSPAALPHLMLLLLSCPQSVSLYFITSTSYSSVCSSLIEHSSDTSEGTRIKNSVWRFPFIVAYMCTKPLFCCTVLLFFFLREFRCLRVLLGVHGPACCLPPFAIKMSMFKASRHPLLCVSLEAIIACACKWPQPFLIDFSVRKSEQLAVPLYQTVW